MQRLLIQAKADGCYELLLLELSAGLRRGELLALQWDDLDLETGELRVGRQVSRIQGKLTVSRPKTDAALRTIVLSPTVTEQRGGTRNVQLPGGYFPRPRKRTRPGTRRQSRNCCAGFWSGRGAPKSGFMISGTPL